MCEREIEYENTRGCDNLPCTTFTVQLHSNWDACTFIRRTMFLYLLYGILQLFIV